MAGAVKKIRRVKFHYFIVGFIFLVVAGSIVSGQGLWGIPGVISMMLMATICTAGIGGLAIIVVSTFLGALIMKVISLFRHSNNSTINRSVADFSVQTQGEQAIKEYYQKARSTGVSAGEIEQNLLQVGWKNEVIQSVLKNIAREGKTPGQG